MITIKRKEKVFLFCIAPQIKASPMFVINTSKLIEIFFECDEFCIEFTPNYQQHLFPLRLAKSHNRPIMTESEMMAIVIFYHLSGMSCFEYYYKNLILHTLKSYFPQAVSYNRFIELMPRILIYTWAFVNCKRAGEETGTYFVDSKKLVACHNLRIYSHKVFKNIAQRGKSSTGWFYGLKLFAVINQFGQLIRFAVTSGNIADNNDEFMVKFLDGLKGKVFGDRGFISSKIFEPLYKKGCQLVTGIRANMKNKLMDFGDKVLLRRRGIIESVFDILTTVCNIEHTRHRSPINAMVNLFAGLAAYSYLDRQPTLCRNIKIK